MAKKNCGNSINDVRNVAHSIGININATRKGKSLIIVRTQSEQEMNLLAHALRSKFINISIDNFDKKIGLIN